MGTLRYVVRCLLEAPSFTGIAVATLALGIGANAAIVSVVDAVLLQPLPYPDADRIVLLNGSGAQPFVMFRSDVGLELSPRELRDSHAFEAIGLAESGGLNLGGERSERIRAARVTPELFTVLGVAPTIGRVFTEEDVAEHQRLVVLSEGLWRSRFTADPEIIGREILLNSMPVLVTGVLPARVEFPERAALWVSAPGNWQLEGAARRPVVVARISTDSSHAEALRELVRIDDELGAGRGDKSLMPLRDHLVGGVRPVLSLLAWAALFVLLVACINVANLLFTRVASRQQELAIRRVLGASRLQLAGHVALESACVSLVAGTVALPVAHWTLEAIRRFVPPSLHGASHVAIDGRTLVGLAALSIATAVLVALLPSLAAPGRAASYDRAPLGATGRGFQQRVRNAFVVTEVAIALVLLSSAATLVATLAELASVDLGARGEDALVVDLTLPHASFDSRDAHRRFYDRFTAELGSLPGVDAVGLTDQIPGDPTTLLTTRPVNVEGAASTEPRRYAVATCASPGYFEALGIDLLTGRSFGHLDGTGGAPVAIVSAGYASALDFDPPDIVGRHTNAAGMMERPESREIVGVVRDVRLHGPESHFSSAIYLPCAERPPFGAGHVVVKAHVDPETLVPAIRRTAARLDSRVPLGNVRPFDEIREQYLADRRLAMVATLAFGALAFGLAIVGLYGVMSYLVQLRTREIGIRLAFGASPTRVKRDVLANGIALASGGLALGTVATLGLSRLAWSGMVGFERLHPPSLLGLVLVVAGVAALASWVPARRATRVDPVHALRFE